MPSCTKRKAACPGSAAERPVSLGPNFQLATTRPQYQILRKPYAAQRFDRLRSRHKLDCNGMPLGSQAFLRSLWMSPAMKISPDPAKPAASANINRKETPFEALASICSVLVVGLFILTF